MRYTWCPASEVKFSPRIITREGIAGRMRRAFDIVHGSEYNF